MGGGIQLWGELENTCPISNERSEVSEMHRFCLRKERDWSRFLVLPAIRMSSGGLLAGILTLVLSRKESKGWLLAHVTRLKGRPLTPCSWAGRCFLSLPCCVGFPQNSDVPRDMPAILLCQEDDKVPDFGRTEKCWTADSFMTWWMDLMPLFCTFINGKF